ncbi:hypothetical protein CCACVL1_08975 [Corchorus capsularis]|uniref:Uncharacterized protein n=1 Tax=Corchorus capsularis TaxID=210143 RepID=A0A1R3IY64_COCAP|nr:hypothetical protein CCACVL1_08975 [Corchorus capsularis]
MASARETERKREKRRCRLVLSY